MSLAALSPNYAQDKPISIALDPIARHTDLEDPRCAQHDRPAVGVATWQTPDDHEQREPFCRSCCWDVQIKAMGRNSSFVPAAVSPIDLALDLAYCEVSA